MEPDKQNLHSNSCIELSVPHEYQQWGPISFCWFRQSMHPSKTSLHQYLTYQSTLERT